MKGWEPKVTTKYHYAQDPDGEIFVKKTVSRSEVEWDEEQYELMAALERYEHLIHPECGHPMDESMSPNADPFAKDRTHIYKADLPIRCHACTALNLEKKKYDGDNYDSARVWTVSKIDLT